VFEDFRYQRVLGEPVRRWAEMATVLVHWCVSVWVEGVSSAPVINCVCRMELNNNNNNRLLGPLTKDQDLVTPVTSVNWKILQFSPTEDFVEVKYTMVTQICGLSHGITCTQIESFGL